MNLIVSKHILSISVPKNKNYSQLQSNLHLDIYQTLLYKLNNKSEEYNEATGRRQ